MIPTRTGREPTEGNGITKTLSRPNTTMLSTEPQRRRTENAPDGDSFKHLATHRCRDPNRRATLQTDRSSGHDRLAEA
jgi:hypothetical protein